MSGIHFRMPFHTFFACQIHPPSTSIINNKRYVNEKKVTDHHAIIPTEQIPDISKLTLDEVKIYDLVVRQVIAAHYNNAIFNYTTIHSLVDNRAEFVTKGKEQIEEGWRKVIYLSKENSDSDEGQNLPSLQEGELGQVTKVDLKKGETQSPKRYTEGNLITLMKTAGKHLDDTELEKVLAKTEGLGTEATRAGIINLLRDRNYIEVNKNQVSATPKGLLLIEALGESILASPGMTAKWEQRLSEIGEGKASPKNFIEQVTKLSHKLVIDAKEQKENSVSLILREMSLRHLSFPIPQKDWINCWTRFNLYRTIKKFLLRQKHLDTFSFSISMRWVIRCTPLIPKAWIGRVTAFLQPAPRMIHAMPVYWQTFFGPIAISIGLCVWTMSPSVN